MKTIVEGACELEITDSEAKKLSKLRQIYYCRECLAYHLTDDCDKPLWVFRKKERKDKRFVYLSSRGKWTDIDGAIIFIDYDKERANPLGLPLEGIWEKLIQ